MKAELRHPHINKSETLLLVELSLMLVDAGKNTRVSPLVETEVR